MNHPLILRANMRGNRYASRMARFFEAPERFQVRGFATIDPPQCERTRIGLGKFTDDFSKKSSNVSHGPGGRGYRSWQSQGAGEPEERRSSPR